MVTPLCSAFVTKLLFQMFMGINELGMTTIDFIIMNVYQFSNASYLMIFHVVMVKSVGGLCFISKGFEVLST